MMDLRSPSGLFFVLMGILLVAMGVVFPETRARLSETNVNLYSGLSMLIFGGVLLWLSRRRN